MSWLSAEEIEQLQDELEALFDKWKNENWALEPNYATVQEIKQAIEKFDQCNPELYADEYQEYVTQIGRAIAQIQDESLLKLFTKVCLDEYYEESWKKKHGVYFSTEVLLEEALRVQWYAGARFLLMLQIIDSESAYISSTAYSLGVTEAWAHSTKRLVQAYLDAGGKLSLPVVQHLHIWYKYLLSGGDPDEMILYLVQIGSHIEQKGESEIRSFCMDVTFFPILQGMLLVAVEARNLPHITQILDLLFKLHQQLWMPDTHDLYSHWDEYPKEGLKGLKFMSGFRQPSPAGTASLSRSPAFL